MRVVLPLVLLAAACGPAPRTAVVEKPPPRDLGPAELGPLPPEVRHMESDAYTADVEAPATASVRQRVQAKVRVRAKEGLFVPDDPFTLETSSAKDVDIAKPVMDRQAAIITKDSITYVVTVVPLRAGFRQISFKLAGSVCDESFCDVVGDQLSWNLEVR